VAGFHTKGVVAENGPRGIDANPQRRVDAKFQRPSFQNSGGEARKKLGIP
jgi:hypothetical protein